MSDADYMGADSTIATIVDYRERFHECPRASAQSPNDAAFALLASVSFFPSYQRLQDEVGSSYSVISDPLT